MYSTPPYRAGCDPKAQALLYRLYEHHALSPEEYEYLIIHHTPLLEAEAAKLAVKTRKTVYGSQIFTRGLIEFTNYCKNGCYYCGINRENKEVERYRLTLEDVLSCCQEGYALGFRTFVLQGGEDPYFTDEKMVEMIGSIRRAFPSCAITLSIGERSYESYLAMYQAGANRYLLRHETADAGHYALLHPKELSLSQRMDCLKSLKSIGYQVGCGFMVGSPGQTAKTLAEDLYFIQNFVPDMCGIGPFIPQHATAFRDKPQGKLHQTLFLLSLLRLIQPNLLLPATTALGTIHPKGREMGILAGANVVMPNLSPTRVRQKYLLYDNKICTGDESAQCRSCLTRRMEAIGYEIVNARGDIKKD